ncbi:MAG: hypothetical protein STSR0006_14630 [Lentimicrobium sp.]|jgi:hypothetical protein
MYKQSKYFPKFDVRVNNKSLIINEEKNSPYRKYEKPKDKMPKKIDEYFFHYSIMA